MFKFRMWPWLLVLLLGGLPVVALLITGVLWLRQQQLWLDWLLLSTSCFGMAWIVGRWLNKRRKQPSFALPIKPDMPLSQQDEQVWNAVTELVTQFQLDKSLDLTALATWLQLGQQTLTVVAKQYRPTAKQPELEIPITELLQIMQLVSRDMHEQISSHLPFSHRLTLADGLNMQKWLDHLGDAKTLLRLGRMWLNPVGGIMNEAKGYAQDKVVDLTLPHLQAWLLQQYTQKVATYAILLYSGRLAVAAEKIAVVSPQSTHDIQQANHQQTHISTEPLRILVAGQTNAGKSSLINLLFAKPRAATDVVSCTAEITPYLVERDGQLSGLIFDTPGYGEHSDWLADNQAVLDQADLILLVCAANNAARAADSLFLKAVYQYFQSQLQRKLPTIIVVVTHIDQLRPSREWLPPYDIETPKTAKAENIRAALDTIMQDLALTEHTAIVPVSMAENAGLVAYNMDSLVQAMGLQMQAAEQARLLRCLKTAQNREKTAQLWQQLGNSGRWLLRKAATVLP